MTPEEVKALVSSLEQGQAVWYALSAVLGGALAGLGGYLAEKGKGRATKEDIGAITREMEKAKEDFNHRLEDLKAHYQLRMVAAEKRLQAHQEAFELWNDLVDNMQKDQQTLKSVIDRCNVWYRSNCIYLGSSSRDVFMTMVGDACIIHGPFLNIGGLDLQEVFRRIVQAGNRFLEALDLPGFTAVQLEHFSNVAEHSVPRSAPL